MSQTYCSLKVVKLLEYASSPSIEVPCCRFRTHDPIADERGVDGHICKASSFIIPECSYQYTEQSRKVMKNDNES